MRNFLCIVGTIIGTLVTGFLVLSIHFGVRDAKSVTDEPLNVGMREAVERVKSGSSTWVWLTDARADCSRSARYTDTSKEGDAQNALSFVALSEARDLEIVVDARDLRDCAYVGRVHFVGVLKKMEDSRRQEFASRGLALPAASGDAWWLCGDCRPGGEWTGVVVLLLLVALSAWLTLKIFRARSG
ncbi:MAG: hypothetical protein ABL891_19210 [Burkholderiales bacterium]